MRAPLEGAEISVRTPGRRRPDGLAPAELDGRKLERIETRGKHLLFHFDGGLALHSHLGMRGSWQLYANGERWRRPARDAWIALTGGGAEGVNFGGSRLRIVRESQLLHDPKLARLGPDVLANRLRPGRRRRADPLSRAGPEGRRCAARPEAGRGHRQHLQIRGLLRGGARPAHSRGGARRRSAHRRPRRHSRPDAGGGRDRAPAEPGLPTRRQAVPSLRDPHSLPGSGRGGPDDLLVSWLSAACQQLSVASFVRPAERG